MGSKPAPLLVLARYGRLQKSQEQKTKTKKKNQLHRFLYKTTRPQLSGNLHLVRVALLSCQ